MDLTKPAGQRMNIERRPKVGGLFNRELTPTPSGSKAPDSAVVQIGVTVDKFQKMKFDVVAHDTIGSDHGTGLAIHVVPATPNLGSQPTAQRPKVLTKTFAVAVWSANAFKLRQELFGEIPLAQPPLWSTAVSRFFANDFVHV